MIALSVVSCGHKYVLLISVEQWIIRHGVIYDQFRCWSQDWTYLLGSFIKKESRTNILLVNSTWTCMYSSIDLGGLNFFLCQTKFFQNESFAFELHPGHLRLGTRCAILRELMSPQGKRHLQVCRSKNLDLRRLGVWKTWLRSIPQKIGGLNMVI